MSIKSESDFTEIHAVTSQERKDLLNDSKDVIESLSNIIGEDGKASVKLCQREDCFESTIEIVKSSHTKSLKNIKSVHLLNRLHEGEILFPYDKELVMRAGNPPKKSIGKVMTEFAHLIPPKYSEWTFIPIENQKDVFLIYNEGMGGYLNAHDNIVDEGRRDAFVSNDMWKIHRNTSTDGAVLLENLPTGEYLYGIVGYRGSQPRLQYFPGQKTRPVFYGSLKMSLKGPRMKRHSGS